MCSLFFNNQNHLFETLCVIAYAKNLANIMVRILKKIFKLMLTTIVLCAILMQKSLFGFYLNSLLFHSLLHFKHTNKKYSSTWSKCLDYKKPRLRVMHSVESRKIKLWQLNAREMINLPVKSNRKNTLRNFWKISFVIHFGISRVDEKLS